MSTKNGKEKSSITTKQFNIGEYRHATLTITSYNSEDTVSVLRRTFMR